MTPTQTNAARTRAYVAARARWAEAMAAARGILEAGVATRRFRAQVDYSSLWKNAAFDSGEGETLYLPHWEDYAAICNACLGVFGSRGPLSAYLADLTVVDRLDQREAFLSVSLARFFVRADLIDAVELAGFPGWAAAITTNNYALAVPEWEVPDA